MKTISKDYTYKSIEELTDNEMESFITFAVNDESLISSITDDIYRDVEDQCQNGLRSMGYMFECDDILYDNYDVPEYLYNLDYIGKLPDDVDISDRVSIGIYGFEFKEKFNINDDIADSIIFNIYYDDYHNTVEAWYIIEDKDDFKKSFEITDQEYESILNFVTDYVSKIKEEYKPFKDDVDQINNWFRKLISFYSKEFEEYMTGYVDLGLYFDEDGNVIDYDWNYNN